MKGRRQLKEGFLSLEKIETWIMYVFPFRLPRRTASRSRLFTVDFEAGILD
jgi:hypothetical protein